MIVLKQVESSMISHVGYDEGAEVLRIKFKRGDAEYAYKNVSMREFTSLMKAKSIGSHFHKHIKKAYVSAKIPQGE